MNIVIGPNGTGKSTVVCAVALGLGGKPDVLGRASTLGDFVKHGYESATIEIELKSAEEPFIVKRHISKTKPSKYKLNGQTANEADIRKAVARRAIQVDNLCQFLPQDKVSGCF
jgi:structural maintenance of chromosomes protein 5